MSAFKKLHIFFFLLMWYLYMCYTRHMKVKEETLCSIRYYCVGKIKEKFYTDAVNEYKKRLSRYAKVDIIEVSDEKTPEQASDLQQEQIRQKEAERLLSKIKDSMYVIALDLKGKKFDSEGFAKHLSMCMNQGKSHIAFVIGGSLGLHTSLLDRADERLSFSDFTFPHQLMRVILFEQIYRANRIMNHEPYHK